MLGGLVLGVKFTEFFPDGAQKNEGHACIFLFQQ